jgi:hypothetical protein
MADLPPYSGPDGPCPRCGVPGAMTEWHWAGLLASADMAGRRPPCAERADLAVLDGAGEHLCRVCLNCGHGWPEACVGRAAAPRRGRLPSPAAGALLLCLASGLASSGALGVLSQMLGGAALVAGWLAVTVAISLLAAIGHAAVASRGAADAPADPAGLPRRPIGDAARRFGHP